MAEEIEVTQDCQALLEFLKRNRGFDFTGYKRSSLMRRLQKRMQTVGCDSCETYLDYLEVHPDEFAHLFNTILINVTGFFRDTAAWEFVKTDIVPSLIRSKGRDQQIRLWSAGCASGEEAYTLAMMLAEEIGLDGVRDRVKIYATDADDEALQEARHAVYSHRAVQGVPPEFLTKYFKQVGMGYVFNSDLRRAVIFGRHDLIHDAPISRIDLLTCRNTLMYFNAEVQAQVLARFHFALNPNAYLMLGKAEMLFTHSHLFLPFELKHRIFTKVSKLSLLDRASMILEGQNGGNGGPAISPSQARLLETVFDATPGAHIVVDQQRTLVLINQRARAQFRMTDKDVGRPLQDLELSYRPVELRSLIDQAFTEQRPIALKDIPYSANIGRPVDIGYLDVQVSPVTDGIGQTHGCIVTFNDVTRFRQLQDELQVANRELETAYEELQSTNEELETTNEELQSTVEELETTNEELQSTNEELETMNEELQSTNEELQAINDELRLRSREVNQLNSFMRSILSSFNVGVVVVDQQMHIEVWNDHAEELWGLRAEEVVDKHLLNLDFGLPVDEIRQPLRLVLAGEPHKPELSLQAINRRGKAIQLKVSISPLEGKDSEGAQGAILLMEQMHENAPGSGL